MNIKEIKIDNYKGFKTLNIQFNKKLNVFIGKNASGKTSLLSAIVKALYNVTSDFAKVNKFTEWNLLLSNNDINYYSNSCKIEIKISKFPNYNKCINSIISLPENKLINNNLIQFKNWFHNQIKSTSFTVPIIKYYPAKRNAIKTQFTNFDALKTTSDYYISQLETWSYLYQDNISYDSFFKWFYENETQELRLQKTNNDLTLQTPSLKGVRIAIKRTLKFLGYDKASIISEQYKKPGNSEFIPFLKIQNQNGNWENLNQKSDGEKAIISLVADIAYNLSLAKDFMVDDNFLNSPGVVLIDEIENHLHPDWQRKIIPLLTEVFPKIQYFITTHSPQVIGSIKSEYIYQLDDFEISKINFRTMGEDTNSLLKYIFNSTERDPKYVQLIDKIDELIEQNVESQELEKLVKKLQNELIKDKSNIIGNIVDELILKIEAYKFEKDYEKNNKK